MKIMKNINKVFFYFKKIKDCCDKEVAEVAKEIGITKPEADVLIYLINNENQNKCCDIVDFRGFSKAYVSKAVKKLVNRGYISYIKDEKDKRYQHIIINAKAKKIVETLNNNQQIIINKMFDGISEEGLTNFKTVINKITNNLERK